MTLKNQSQEGISWDVQEYWSPCSYFLLIPFNSAALRSFKCFGQNLIQIMAPKKDRKRDFRVLLGSKLSMSQQPALAAEKASSTLSSTNRSTASTALPEKTPSIFYCWGKRRVGKRTRQYIPPAICFLKMPPGCKSLLPCKTSHGSCPAWCSALLLHLGQPLQLLMEF